MKGRGEKSYINMPFFAVKLYDNLTSVKGVNKAFEEIIKQSKFEKSYHMQQIELGNLSIWLRIELTKV